MSKKDVYLGLGSNLGNRKQNIKEAVDMLAHELGAPVCVSTIIKTPAWGFTSPNPFLNMVAVFSTDVSPLELLDITEGIEYRLGRKVKTGHDGVYSDRPIDIDILLYGDEVISTERLKIPHPRMHERSFVLIPLSEISPNLIHPTLGKSIHELMSRLMS